MRSGFQCADAAKYEAAAESVCGGFALQIFLFQMLYMMFWGQCGTHWLQPIQRLACRRRGTLRS